MNGFHEQIIHGVVRDLHLSEPELYVDNRSRDRSGHMSHALIQTRSGRVLDFNSNCSAYRFCGHAAFGWIEYRISEDLGETFGEIRRFPYAYEEFLKGNYTVSVEKGICCEDGTVVVFCLMNSQMKEISCEPWIEPRVVRSLDEGETWEPPTILCGEKGRVYDARYVDGKIYVLMACNDAAVHFCANKPEHLYRLYVSEDSGRTFREESVVGFADSMNLGYGALVLTPDQRLIAYAYNLKDEQHMSYAVSRDLGKTWCESGTCYLANRTRNPQINCLDGQYFLFGRCSSDHGCAVYTSADALHWDEGHVLNKDNVSCYYSNSILLDHPRQPGKKRLLVQFSEVYPHHEPRAWNATVNVKHMWVESLS